MADFLELKTVVVADMAVVVTTQVVGEMEAGVDGPKNVR